VALSRASAGLVAGLTVLVALVVGGVTALALGPMTLDPAAVQRDVATQFEREHGVAVELSCPDAMEVASGGVYSCAGTTSAREEVTIEIRIADSLDGAYTWVVVRPVR
jgi:hypothetical protein